MADIKPRVKHIEYETLSAKVDFTKRELTITLNSTGESIVIPSQAYGELQAIMADIGRQANGTPSRR